MKVPSRAFRVIRKISRNGDKHSTLAWRVTPGLLGKPHDLREIDVSEKDNCLAFTFGIDLLRAGGQCGSAKPANRVVAHLFVAHELTPDGLRYNHHSSPKDKSAACIDSSCCFS